jgi:D-beta-D-heptose 7-phosphate kinase/D-beta-D-heptose 1-phosphate adenosyltransferase
VRKLRVVAQRQQVVRLDWEDLTPATLPNALPLIAQLQAGARPDASVLSDYAKGFLSPAASRHLIELGTQLGVPVLVDPKVDDLAVFRGATVVTPNLKEFEAVVGGALPELDSDAFAELVGRERERAGLGALVVTLGDRGVLVSSAGAEAVALQADKRDVYDVTGAGDTLIAVLALALGGDVDLVTAASIANAAAGVAVRQFGTATVTLDQLARELSRRPLGTTLSPSELHEQVAMWRLQGTRMVFTNGCFDVLHAGHLALLRQAASLGDVLVVGINDDASVTRLKGEGRPLTPQDERCALVAALDCVDAVTLFSDDTPLRLIEQVLPAVLVKGADYALADVVGRGVVEAAGGQVVLAALVDQRSTSRLIDKARGKS